MQWVVTQASCLTCPVLLGGACASGNKELPRYPGDVSYRQGPAALQGGLVLGGEESWEREQQLPGFVSLPVILLLVRASGLDSSFSCLFVNNAHY